MTISQIKKVHEEFNLVQDIEEFKWLIDKVITIKPETILEIGIERGGSFQCWMYLADLVVGVDLKIPDNLIGMDAILDWKEAVPCFCEGNSHDEETIERVFNGLDYFLSYTDGVYPNRKIDFLFIDGDHTYDGVKKDFCNYSQFVREGGLIGFHDIHDVGGVKKFWNELKSKGYKTEEITKTIGTGLLYV